MGSDNGYFIEQMIIEAMFLARLFCSTMDFCYVAKYTTPYSGDKCHWL